MPNLSDKLHFDSVHCDDAFELIDITYCIHNPTDPFGCHAIELTDGEHCNYKDQGRPELRRENQIWEIYEEVMNQLKVSHN